MMIRVPTKIGSNLLFPELKLPHLREVSRILAAMLGPRELPLHTVFNLRTMMLLAIQTVVTVVQIRLCCKMVNVVGATTKVTESLPIIAKVERAMELIPLLQTLVVAGTISSRREWQEHNPETRNGHPVSSILAAVLSPQEPLHTVLNLWTMVLLTFKTVVAVVDVTHCKEVEPMTTTTTSKLTRTVREMQCIHKKPLEYPLLSQMFWYHMILTVISMYKKHKKPLEPLEHPLLILIFLMDLSWEAMKCGMSNRHFLMLLLWITCSSSFILNAPLDHLSSLLLLAIQGSLKDTVAAMTLRGTETHLDTTQVVKILALFVMVTM